MLITLLQDTTHTGGDVFKSHFVAPNQDAIVVQANTITLYGDTLKSIQISLDGGYTYNTMACGGEYTGKALIKANLYGLKGYKLHLQGNASLSGRLSKFGAANGLFEGAIDVSELILDVPDCEGLFSQSNIITSPVFIDQPYNLSTAFYGCDDLEFLDFQNISDENLLQSNLKAFCPSTTNILFNADASKEVIDYVLSNRY